jgi:hypothetical protein
MAIQTINCKASIGNDYIPTSLVSINMTSIKSALLPKIEPNLTLERGIGRKLRIRPLESQVCYR